ncbi:mitochondrial 2-methylisocitrate lyase [Marasmius sp. AFHP31]|nr:mitochondrial 2-methylisocitrate lyase [Marasmius sp. AFHP31]
MAHVDYLRPIVADADTGAFAVHFEDQLHGGKKCGHLSGKVLVPTSTHTSRLVSARFQLDLLKSTMLIIARTDAESGKLISSAVDVADHEFVKGTTVPGKPIEGEWMGEHRLVTFGEAEAAINVSTIKDKEGAVKTFRDATAGKSISDMRDYEGYTGASYPRAILPRNQWSWCEFSLRIITYPASNLRLLTAIKRATTFAPYADLVWLETKTPDIEEARYFARKIRETYPETRLVYNLSPRFNWFAHGFRETDLKNFCWELGKEGFVLQLISLAGLHSNATATAELAARYKEDGVLAYVQLAQRKEKEVGCDVLTHQKWSGAYVDKIL